MCSTLARMGMWRWCSEQWKAGPAQNPGSCNNSLWPTKTGTLDNGSAALEDSFPSRHLLCDLPRGKRNIYLPIYEVLMRHQSRILFESSLVTWEFSWLLTEAWVIKRQLHPRKYQLNIHDDSCRLVPWSSRCSLQAAGLVRAFSLQQSVLRVSIWIL